MNPVGLVDVIVVAYRSGPALADLLASFELHEGSRGACLVHVVNNGPEEPQLTEWARKGRLQLYQNSWNQGYARAVNRVLASCRGDFTLIVNPDVRWTMPMVESLCRFMKEHEKVGIVGPKILNEDGTLQGSARSFPTWNTALFGRSSFMTRFFPSNALSRANVRDEELAGRGSYASVDWVSGACLFVRRQAVEEVGGMDERFFLYWEDADWCRRMWAAGWQVVYWPKVSVVHTGGVSSRERAFASLTAFHRSAVHYYVKYRSRDLQWADPLVAGALGLRLLGLLGWKMVQKLNAPKN